MKFDERDRLARDERRRLAGLPAPVSMPSWRPRREPEPVDATFYDKREWLELRYRALQIHGGHCQCCGNGPSPGNPLQVDHIKPRSKFPELELDLHNLQVLCKSCNMGKGAWDQTDWRRHR